MKAAAYTRVSTDLQEQEGTSLQSQLEACLNKAQELGYEVSPDHRIQETYSGLSLDRPRLGELRQWVRDNEVDVVVAYALDRLSRDPVHFIILQEEMERAGVELVLVSETVDSSDMGKLISHIRGFAAKLEAEKIRERTTRGLRERAKSGRFPSGRRGRLYGYTYIPGKGLGQGVREVNEEDARRVREIFDWFVNEGLGIDRIAFRLRDLGVPTPSGKGIWYASEIWRMLKCRAYIGETYAFAETYVEPKSRLSKGSRTRKTRRVLRPPEEWVRLPDATPPIIERDLFEKAQEQLQRNKERARRNRKQPYLLSGHILCKRCGRNYWGFVKRVMWGGTRHPKRYYHCAGKLRMVSPTQCDNHNLNAGGIEDAVWGEIENLLSQPSLILGELERKRAEGDTPEARAAALREVVRSLVSLDREQDQLLQWALKGFPEQTVISENQRINRLRAEFKERESELRRSIEETGENEWNLESVAEFCETVRQKLGNLRCLDMIRA